MQDISRLYDGAYQKGYEAGIRDAIAAIQRCKPELPEVMEWRKGGE
jgi:hypothetical protein